MNIKKTVILLMGLTVMTAAINIISNLVSLSQSFSSFPWWSVFMYAGIYYGPTLLLEGLALLGIHLWQKHKKK